MERRELGRSGVSVSRIVLGCGNFGGVGSSPAFFGQGIPKDEADADHGRGLGARDHDVRHRRRVRRRTERDLDRRVARGEGRRRSRRDRRRDEDVQSGRGGRRPRSRRRAHPRGRSTRASTRLGLERVALYFAHDFDPDTPQEETLRAFTELVRSRQDRSGRRLELHRRAARRGGRAVRARGPRPLRGRPELVLAPRRAATRRPSSPSAASTVSATRRSARSRAGGSRASTGAARSIPKARA